MIRYQLDNLGWFQFEQLTQSLIKAQFGAGIHSLGGHGDWGMDAFYEGDLEYPSKYIKKTGFFIFQIKFVENANASGAKPNNALLKSIKKEIQNIKERLNSKWKKKVDYYIFITNAPILSAIRVKIESLFKTILPKTHLYLHNGNDVCGWLDTNPQIRKSFPQLLSIRDLDHVLTEVVNRRIIVRSEKSIELAKEIASVFIPTKAYRDTWNNLNKYNFVVLDGPPEVGKTAIALMIALIQVLEGWEAVYCSKPEEIFQSYNSKQKQIFIADDAFGRTEYYPERGRLWEKELPHLMMSLGKKQWLILTSRKHILDRAFKDMDLQFRAEHFPQPAKIFVDATALSKKEKALILYQHAKAANLFKKSKEILKLFASSIVDNKNFTPERIRRFISDRLPELSKRNLNSGFDDISLRREIENSINRPTERMIKTFDKLSISHKWLLISLLANEADIGMQIEELKRIYTHYCPPEKGWADFFEVLDELCEAFIKKSYYSKNKLYISWIHPSYRDLVIDKIIKDYKLSEELLENANIDILLLSLSDAGGAKGKRSLPLLINSNRWDIFKKRCIEVIVKSDSGWPVYSLLSSLISVYKVANEEDLKNKIANVSEEIIKKIIFSSKNAHLNRLILESFFTLRELLSLNVLPDLEIYWQISIDVFRIGILKWKTESYIDAESLNQWIDSIETINKYEHNFLISVGFPENYNIQLGEYVEFAKSELETDLLDSNPNNLRSFSESCKEIAENLGKIKNILGDSKLIDDEIIMELEEKSKDLQNKALEIEADENGYDYPDDIPYEDVFDVDGLFVDL